MGFQGSQLRSNYISRNANSKEKEGLIPGHRDQSQWEQDQGQRKGREDKDTKNNRMV